MWIAAGIIPPFNGAPCNSSRGSKGHTHIVSRRNKISTPILRSGLLDRLALAPQPRCEVSATQISFPYFSAKIIRIHTHSHILTKLSIPCRVWHPLPRCLLELRSDPNEEGRQRQERLDQASRLFLAILPCHCRLKSVSTTYQQCIHNCLND
jgi:hypothetical protein